jgi:hypothetical protein
LSAEDLPVLRSATTSKADLLSLVKPGHTGALDRVDVYEDILAAARMKPKPFWLLNHFTVPFVI